MIVAVDFDGILCEDAFPEIGKPNYCVISAVRQLMDAGHDVILWTSRVDDKLEEAIKWCGDYGLHFCAVNDNAPNNLATYGTNPRKIYADVYIDDRSMMFIRWARLSQDVSASIALIINEINYILKECKEDGKD